MVPQQIDHPISSTMPEITSEPLNPNPSTAASPPPSATRPNAPGVKRLLLTLTVLASFLISLPLLLSSTSIHRSPLPFHSIRSLSVAPRPDPPCLLHAVFLSPSSDPHRLATLLSDATRRAGDGRAANRGGCDWKGEVLVTVDRGGECTSSREGERLDLWKCGGVGEGELGAEAERVDELLRGVAGSGGEDGESVYTVVAGSEGVGELRAVVGRYRHGWVTGGMNEDEKVAKIAGMFVEVFVGGGTGGGDEEGGMKEFMPVGLDGSITLSFSLLNSDPRDWVYGWDFQVLENLLGPVIEALAPLANIRVESQVLYHTPKSAFSHWDKKLLSYVFNIGDLPFFVNSNEWHLDTSIMAGGRSKVLQFVVYVPSVKECPLLLQLPDKNISETNAFVSPMWGGVIVWNPPTCSPSAHSNHLSKDITPQDLRKLFEIFIGQLRYLFGLKSGNFHAAELGLSNLLGSRSGFADWELDFLFRRHACYYLQSSATTLESLSNLVQSLPRMIVMDEIGKQVALSLDAAGLAQKDASFGVYNASAAFARQARALAEDAFFHPSISSISYSSLEHYFAIYMPFFAPVSLHVLLAVVKELRRYKHERAKYLTFIASKNEAS